MNKLCNTTEWVLKADKSGNKTSKDINKNMNNITLDLSGVVEKNGKKIAHVRFNRGKDFAEGYIPDCVFTQVEGFTDDEVSQLTDYLRANLTDLKKRAAHINPLTGLMGKKE